MRIVKIGLLALMTVAIAGLAGAYSIQTEDKGAPRMTLDGGKSGPVTFPHLAHQKALEDCSICHTMFPQEAGAIDALKAEGELKPKQVMNKQCTKCHKQFKLEGRKTGPTTCKTCHVMN